MKRKQEMIQIRAQRELKLNMNWYTANNNGPFFFKEDEQNTLSAGLAKKTKKEKKGRKTEMENKTV